MPRHAAPPPQPRRTHRAAHQSLSRRFRAVTAALALGVAAATGLVASQAASSTAAADPQPAHVRAAFYYPWYPETENWSTKYDPKLGRYDSSNATVLASHVAMAKYAGLDAFISSWWGAGTKTAQRLPLLLDAARAQGFQVAPYYEPESNATPPTAAKLKSDLDVLYTQANGDPAWLLRNGKPVLFVYNTGKEAACTAVTRMKTASAGRFYLDLKLFSGYTTCSSQPDQWHQYGPATGYQASGTRFAAISPGFNKFSESTPRLARDLSRFKTDLSRQVASNAVWQLTTTFNEWGEGTSVEPATEWQSESGMGTYLDAMRLAYTGQGPVVPTPSDTTTTAASSTASSSVADSSTPAVIPSDTSVSNPSTTASSVTASSSSDVATSSSASTASSSESTTAPPPSSSTNPPPPAVNKVLVFIEENHSLAQMQSGMPYLYSQATKYGYANNYAAITHPSLPNYLAIAFGSTFGVTDDSAPSAHPESAPDVFTQAIQNGYTAKSYQQSMTSNCATVNQGRYAVKHNPWAYDTTAAARTACTNNDVPSGSSTNGRLYNDIVAGALPNVGEVTPDLDNDAHDGTLATADAWLKGWLTLLYNSPDWQSGHLAIIVTADEDDRNSGNKVLTVVMHPSQTHHVVTTPLTHYSLTRLLTDLTHTPCIRSGCTAASMSTAFALPLA